MYTTDLCRVRWFCEGSGDASQEGRRMRRARSPRPHSATQRCVSVGPGQNALDQACGGWQQPWLFHDVRPLPIGSHHSWPSPFLPLPFFHFFRLGNPGSGTKRHGSGNQQRPRKEPLPPTSALRPSGTSPRKVTARRSSGTRGLRSC